MKNIITILTTLVLGLSINCYSQWTQTNGPYGGSIIDFCYSDSGSYLFSGTAYGGIFKSSNNGSYWLHVNNGLSDININCLKISNYPNYIFAGTNTGLFRSSDYGGNWTKIGFADTMVISILIHNNSLIVGTHYGGIHKSTNFGNNWTSVNNGVTCGDIFYLKASGNILYAASKNCGIYKSTNYGTNWTLVNDNFVRALEAFGNNVFAGLAYTGGIIRSTNNGVSWQPINNGFTNKESNSLMLSGSYLFTGLAGSGIYGTTNNGNNWIAYNSGLMDLDVLSLGKSNSYIYTGTDCGIFRSSNNGSNWSSANVGIKAEIIHAMTISNTFDVYAGSYGGRIFKTTNNGTNWTETKNGLEGSKITSMITHGSYLFAGTFGSGVYISTNNGNNWVTANTDLGNLFIYSLVSNGTALFAGTADGVYRTINNGTRWQYASNGINYPVIRDMTTSGSYVIAGTDSGLYRSTNNGVIWTSDVSGLPYPYCVWKVKATGSNIYSFILDYELNYTVCRSTNNGTNWFIVNTSFFTPARDIFSVIAYDNYVIAGTRSGIFLSTNFGANWIEKNDGIGSNISSGRALLIANNYIFAGYRGRSVWKRELNEFLNPVKNMSSEIPSVFLLDQNYPNPFNPKTTIGFSIPTEGNVTLTIYDILGREIETLINETLRPGNYNVSWNGGMNASGIYIYKISVNSFVQTKKMVLIK